MLIFIIAETIRKIFIKKSSRLVWITSETSEYLNLYVVWYCCYIFWWIQTQPFRPSKPCKGYHETSTKLLNEKTKSSKSSKMAQGRFYLNSYRYTPGHKIRNFMLRQFGTHCIIVNIISHTFFGCKLRYASLYRV